MGSGGGPPPQDEGFWRFSLALYARSGVAEALLSLQDRCGCNVNIVLFALWIGATRGRRLDADALRHAESAIAAIDEAAIKPLRRLRRELKSTAADPDIAAVRRRIANLELVAERRAQSRLAAVAASLTGEITDRIGAAAANLSLCTALPADAPEASVILSAVHRLLRCG